MEGDLEAVFQSVTPAGDKKVEPISSARAASQSSPPRDASPPVERTSTAPPPTSSRETSKVPVVCLCVRKGERCVGEKRK